MVYCSKLNKHTDKQMNLTSFPPSLPSSSFSFIIPPVCGAPLFPFTSNDRLRPTTPPMSYPVKSVPLVAHGHTRPVTHLSFSVQEDDGTHLLVSSCKDGNPMLRDWKGDWIGTFIGHKGAVWSTKLSLDCSKAASGSADFTAYRLSASSGPLMLLIQLQIKQENLGRVYGRFATVLSAQPHRPQRCTITNG